MGNASLILKRGIKESGKARVTPKPAVSSRDDGIERLVEQLVQRARQINSKGDRISKPAFPALSGREEVLLDIDTDGVRCIILQPTHEPEREKQGPERDAVILSPREQEIVRMVIKGHPNKTIAAVLEISTWTVATYLRRIYARLGVGTRASMVARVLETAPREVF